MKISIALATYNGEDFLAEQLNSYLAQTRLPDELIVCDDCSTDNTVQLINAFAASAPFPVTLHVNDSQLGYAQNFNRALTHATGDLVLPSDQDDYWFPEKLAYMEKVAIAKEKYLLLMNDAEFADAFLQASGLTKLEKLKSAGFTREYFVMGCCMSIRRELLDLMLPIPDKLASHDLWLSGLADILKIKYVDSCVLQLYRQHDDNTSSFFINSTRRVTRLGGAMYRIRSAVAHLGSGQSLTNELMTLSEFLDHMLEKSEEFSALVGKKQFSLQERELEYRVERLGAREAIRQLPRHRRLQEMIRLVRCGGYHGMAGFLSALKDAII